MALYQFFGGIMEQTKDKEQTTAIILEELVKFSRLDPDDETSGFFSDMIKPILKSVVYIVTIRHNILLEDTKQAFGIDDSKWPKPVKESILEQKQLVDSLNDYIDQL